MRSTRVEFAKVFEAPPQHGRVAVISESRFRRYMSRQVSHDLEAVLQSAVFWQSLGHEQCLGKATGFYVDLTPETRRAGWSFPQFHWHGVSQYPHGTFTYWCPIEAVAGFYAMYFLDPRSDRDPTGYFLVIKDEFLRRN